MTKYYAQKKVALNQHAVKLAFALRMVVEKDVLIVLIGSMVDLETLSMIGTVQPVSNEYFLMIREVVKYMNIPKKLW